MTELILMEIGDPFMMRKCLIGIKQRAERLAAGRRRQAAESVLEHGTQAKNTAGPGGR